jgi:hypothetical protein
MLLHPVHFSSLNPTATGNNKISCPDGKEPNQAGREKRCWFHSSNRRRHFHRLGGMGTVEEARGAGTVEEARGAGMVEEARGAGSFLVTRGGSKVCEGARRLSPTGFNTVRPIFPGEGVSGGVVVATPT